MNRYMQATRSELEHGVENALTELAAIEAQRARVEQDFRSALHDLNEKIHPLKTKLGQMQAELASREARDSMVPEITDHALLRCMERIHGIDVGALKADLMTEGLETTIRSGASKYKTAEGDFLIKGASVVTFLTSDKQHKPNKPNKPTRAQREAMEAA